MSMRQHGELPEPQPQITGAVDGIAVSSDAGTNTVMFTVPTYSPDLKYGPAPFTGNPIDLPPDGARILVLFTAEGRAWVLGWTDQP